MTTQTYYTDSATYHAKATLPANGWRSDWLTYSAAVEAAKKFVKDWQGEGIANAKAAVFYRDGKCASEISGELLDLRIECMACGQMAPVKEMHHQFCNNCYMGHGAENTQS